MQIVTLCQLRYLHCLDIYSLYAYMRRGVYPSPLDTLRPPPVWKTGGSKEWSQSTGCAPVEKIPGAAIAHSPLDDRWRHQYSWGRQQKSRRKRSTEAPQASNGVRNGSAYFPPRPIRETTERRKFPQWGPGLGRPKINLVHFKLHKTLLVDYPPKC